MAIIRTSLIVLALALVLAFSADNWTPVTVHVWGALVLDTRLPALIMLAYLVGALPIWLVAKAGHWRLRRRIAQLENALAAASRTPGPAESDIHAPAPHGAETSQ